MAVFLDLPPELLVPIFHSLGSIDDVHYFGRTCRKTYDIIQRQSDYVKIMRSVIAQSPQHRYELQLSRMLKFHGAVVEEMQQNSSQLPATPHTPGFTLNRWEGGFAIAMTPSHCDSKCRLTCYSDGTVHDILARYQGLRVLENIWLKRQLTASDYLAPDETVDVDDLMHIHRILVRRNEMFQDGDMLSRRSNTPETALYGKLNADQRARFYAAVSYVWLLNEIRWFLTNFVYPIRFDVQVAMLQNAKEYLKGQRHVPLLDEIDNCAVFKFLYHHLLPLHGTALADRDSSKLPFTFSSDSTEDGSHSARLLQLFLHAGQTYLQPPDLIDLIARSQVSRKSPYPVLTLPTTTEKWHRPSQAFAFPANIPLCDERYKRTLLRASLTHLNLIARSSFHQTRATVSPTVTAPADEQLYDLRDHANHYFLDSVLVEFERYEKKATGDGKKRDNIRSVFETRWENVLWSVWWWANSEDKARAKMERWREVEGADGEAESADGEVESAGGEV